MVKGEHCCTDVLFSVLYTARRPFHCLAITYSLKPLLRRLPINHIPNRRKVLRLAVLVLQIVCVLPRINAKNWSELPYNGILVRVRLDTDGAGLCVLHQPRPTRALDAGERGVELLFESIQGAVGGVDCFGETAGWRIATAGRFGSEVLPEEGVVCVAACRKVSTF